MLSDGLEGLKLDRAQARKLAIRIVKEGVVIFCHHARVEMDKDDLYKSDVNNILLSPQARITKEPEFKNGSYRYNIETQRIGVCVAFVSETKMTVVSAWRINR